MKIMNKIAILILAAGKGKRMKSDLPKVLAKLADKPLIQHVIETTQHVSPDKTILIVGHKKEDVISFVDSLNLANIEYAVQSEQLGTGHAVMMAEDNLKEFDGEVLILAGDVPLLSTSTINNFIKIHNDNEAIVSVLSTIAPEPTGYGRIVRDDNGNFTKITEEKDADEKIKKIDEINSGIFLVNSKKLFDSLHKIENNNAQKEYYLTDIIEILKNQNIPVYAHNLAKFDELQGINSQDDLKRAEMIYNKNVK